MSEHRPSSVTPSLTSSVTKALAAYGPRPSIDQVRRAELALVAEAAQQLAQQNQAIALDRIALEAAHDQLDAGQKDLALQWLHAQASPFDELEARRLATELSQLHTAIEAHVQAWARLDAKAVEVAAGTEQLRQRALELLP